MIEERKGAVEAENILEDLGIDELPVVPEQVADHIDDPSFRVVMERKSFDSEKILGKAIGNASGALVYVNSNISDQRRVNFTSAHELGHVCMHIMRELGNEFECGKKEFYNPHTDPKEKEANGFSAGLLMPKSLITCLTDNDLNWANVQTISDRCGTSLEATYRRFSVLDGSPSALLIHKNGKFIRFVKSANFDLFLEKMPLSYEQKSLCVDITSEPYPSDFEEVSSSDWVSSSYREYTIENIYSSSLLLNDGYTYSLLTYDEDCLIDEND